MKRIYAVTMDNGEVWGIAAEVIADNYAKYYEERGEQYQNNFDFMIYCFDNGDFEFADWAKNNMDWEDVKDRAVLLERNQNAVDYEECWVNGKYEYMRQEGD